MAMLVITRWYFWWYLGMVPMALVPHHAGPTALISHPRAGAAAHFIPALHRVLWICCVLSWTTFLRIAKEKTAGKWTVGIEPGLFATFYFGRVFTQAQLVVKSPRLSGFVRREQFRNMGIDIPNKKEATRWSYEWSFPRKMMAHESWCWMIWMQLL